MSLLLHGGPVLIILAILSVISIAVLIFKVIELASVLGGQNNRRAALALWTSGDRSGAEAMVRQGRAPADRVVTRAMELLSRGVSGPMLEAELARRGNEEVSRMSRMIRFLELVAMVSPLLGLLGTVLGMIQSFQDLETAQGAANAAVLAGGIWEALMTTAAGLVVAIPAAIGASMFNARIELATQAIESAVVELQLVDHVQSPAPDHSGAGRIRAV